MPGLTDAAQWRLSFRAAGVQQKKERKKNQKDKERGIPATFNHHPGIGKQIMGIETRDSIG